ncbi:hypothetical protein D1646_04180 [Pseudoflavonifractor sp. 60]|uniref:polysaccharide deacetylase family protein n=1 Tax=Pseudoflavonifractor sp. 60 TaxID=2304576 RepID=UPI00136EEE57|nr:polysaccharide deacetylase family protein [Pseudoflavonifractor sp. 60]NBI66020.1 hypothetical protein [Pseudoflavonifractor sp. 60]
MKKIEKLLILLSLALCLTACHTGGAGSASATADGSAVADPLPAQTLGSQFEAAVDPEEPADVSSSADASLSAPQPDASQPDSSQSAPQPDASQPVSQPDASQSALQTDSEPQPVQPQEPAKKNYKLYVLMYHHFVEEGAKCNPWILTDVRFREDLQWLADHNYTTVLPSELAAGQPLPARAVMITMDDGYASNYRLAFPLLQEFQAKAVISLITQYTQDEDPLYLTWDMCREMADSGLVEFGSHTHASHGEGECGIKRHKGESREEYEARILPDIQTSIDLITEHLGTAPQLFTYPNGIKDSWAAGFIQEHFAITLTTVWGHCDISKGLYSMQRYNVSMDGSLSDILPA